MTSLAVRDTNTTAIAARIEDVLINGNLAMLQPAERIDYYNRLCDSLGLNPLTKPFDYITLQGKLTLYATRDAADQLRKIHGVNIEIISQSLDKDTGLYTVHVRATDRDGRTDEDLGVVTAGQKTGDDLANAILKAVTKSKRRVTLSICGLRFLDETEVADIPERDKRPAVAMPTRRVAVEAAPVSVDLETGEIDPTWSNAELTALLKGSGLKVADLASIVGPIGRDNYREIIDAWLAENPDKSLASLIGMAGAERDGVAPVRVQPEQEPFE